MFFWQGASPPAALLARRMWRSNIAASARRMSQSDIAARQYAPTPYAGAARNARRGFAPDPTKGRSPFGIPQYFCRSVDADPRKQGMSEGSVLAHVTEANDEADKGDAPLGEQNGALPRTPPKGLSPFGIPQSWAFFGEGSWVLVAELLGGKMSPFGIHFIKVFP